ncbi:T9SS type A sorting domain-containing protein [uncultured Microscilla sp.]|uniref:T9SS type A sorting domain-containing protein n=1 Tax=uncultured Microscilla sp. TaxID=432653 RepID=UPI00261982DA|nr:T9SS type A sorting domain-containing protein [uncultured Microscilla sp.]
MVLFKNKYRWLILGALLYCCSSLSGFAQHKTITGTVENRHKNAIAIVKYAVSGPGITPENVGEHTLKLKWGAKSQTFTGGTYKAAGGYGNYPWVEFNDIYIPIPTTVGGEVVTRTWVKPQATSSAYANFGIKLKFVGQCPKPIQVKLTPEGANKRETRHYCLSLYEEISLKQENINGKWRFVIGKRNVLDDTFEELCSCKTTDLPEINTLDQGNNDWSSLENFEGEDYFGNPLFCWSNQSLAPKTNVPTFYSCSPCRAWRRLTGELVAPALIVGANTFATGLEWGSWISGGYASLLAGSGIDMKRESGGLVKLARLASAAGPAVAAGLGAMSAHLFNAGAEKLKEFYFEACEGIDFGGGRVTRQPVKGATQALVLGPKALIYPNPTTGASTLALRLTQANELSVEVYNLQGQVVNTQLLGSIGAGVHRIPLATAGLKAGNYIVKITGVNGLNITQRLVRQ